MYIHTMTFRSELKNLTRSELNQQHVGAVCLSSAHAAEKGGRRAGAHCGEEGKKILDCLIVERVQAALYPR